jgi:hypothetical protein
MGAGTLIGARLLQYSGALVLFGASLFYLYGFRPGAPRTTAGHWSWKRSVLLTAASVALLGALIWVMAETACGRLCRKRDLAARAVGGLHF